MDRDVLDLTKYSSSCFHSRMSPYNLMHHPVVIVAAATAAQLHRGQLYGNQPGSHYFKDHLVPVVQGVINSYDWDNSSLGPISTEEQIDTLILAYFHDTYEDGLGLPINVAHIVMPWVGQERAGRIATMIYLISREDRETYFDYVRRLTQAPPSMRRQLLRTKREDLRANRARLSDGHTLIRRYERALAIIEEYIASPKGE